ncbi:MAG: type II toxin-antitoxin system HicA family toxin [bacterium]|nr:type II toxin-antitoxin system HicA family toxin [bacterium]
MPKNIAWRKLVKNFKELGFTGPYAGGRHLFMKKGELKAHIPNKHEGDISAGLVCEILRQVGVKKKDWDKLK